MIKKIYLICRYFKENSGSYSGVFESFAKYVNKKGIEVVILSGHNKGDQWHKITEYAEIQRFPLSKWKVPLLGINGDYMALSKGVKTFFKNNPILPGDIIIANGRAALGILDKKYILRSGQPAMAVLKAMEIAKNKVSIITRCARFINSIITKPLEKICYVNATAFMLPSTDTKSYINNVSKIGKRPCFIPFSGIGYGIKGGEK